MIFSFTVHALLFLVCLLPVLKLTSCLPLVTLIPTYSLRLLVNFLFGAFQSKYHSELLAKRQYMGCFEDFFPASEAVLTDVLSCIASALRMADLGSPYLWFLDIPAGSQHNTSHPGGVQCWMEGKSRRAKKLVCLPESLRWILLRD